MTRISASTQEKAKRKAAKEAEEAAAAAKRAQAEAETKAKEAAEKQKAEKKTRQSQKADRFLRWANFFCPRPGAVQRDGVTGGPWTLTGGCRHAFYLQ